MAPHGIYPTAGDDRWISLAIAGDDEWRALVREMDTPAWAQDDSLCHTPERIRRRDELDAHLSSWTREHERDALVTRLRAAGLAVAPVLELDEMNQLAQLTERGLREDAMSFEGAPAPVYNTPWHLSLTPRAIGGPSPRVGEHNDAVFSELLGLSSDETADLIERKVIG
jgi:crotonobetainyl-CoA:carnitine CoA-transferase CaiB-like acyl-CoA transferase